MALWPDGDNRPKVIYVCSVHGRCGTGNRLKGEDGKFNLCRFCLADEGKTRRCVRVPIIPVSAVKSPIAEQYALLDRMLLNAESPDPDTATGQGRR